MLESVNVITDRLDFWLFSWP